MIINHNISAMNTHRMMGINQNATSKSLEKLSSGLRINRAGDDAAGLAISEKMRGQIRGLDQASRNSQDGISLIQTGEGALNETQSILQRMRELSVQSGSDTNTSQDRSNIQSEMTQLTNEIDRIGNTTEFNTKKLLDGSMGAAVNVAVANANTNAALTDSAGGAITTAKLLTNLSDSVGNSLQIKTGDSLTINYQVNGSTFTATINVISTTDVASVISALDAAANTSTTISGSNLVVTAATAGFAGAVNGLTLTVKDSTGAIRTAATNSFSNFSQTTQAANVQSNGQATFQIGANANQTITLGINDMRASALGVAGLQVTTQSQATVAIKSIDAALQTVSAQRGNLGAIQNRLEHTISNLDTSSENLQASESRIRDVDMAKEMMNFTKSNILNQASQAMLAQANQQPQGVLSLLR
ncbi:flagellin [Paenibacillus sp. GCM10027628]|uniref:flagellin N-terminal helical domain-containing protein n=1 Tax=Paenibacillus sp. GCM10027628 TaxID=3273413 RepID=UPI0036450E39